MSDRKYRQSGYQDEEPHEKKRQGPRPRKEGPRGRGLGAPTATVFRCSQCGFEVDGGYTLTPTATCKKCGADLHTCTNCRHFDTAAANECREPVPEPVAKKAKSNECELFAPKTTSEFASDRKETPEGAKEAFDALFDF